jgi:hypothetical protein
MEQDWNFDTVVLHHSGNSGRKDPKEIQLFHMKEKGYDDLAYQYVILPDGKIAEGRYLAHKGAANAAVNTGKIGVLVAGDFEPGLFDFSDDEPTAAQLVSTRRLVTALKAEFSTLSRLVGHKDLKDTECPGKELYRHLPALRAATGLTA